MDCPECKTVMVEKKHENETYHRCNYCGKSVVVGSGATYTRTELPEMKWKPLPFCKEAPFIISKENFNNTFIERLDHCKALIVAKEAEYSQGDVDRMIQFVEDARMNNITVAQSAWNMFSKHVTSLRLAIKNEEKVTEKWLQDRITDMVIYPIIIEAILRRAQLGS